MSQARHNGQDVPAKVVGRRVPPPPGIENVEALQKTMIWLREGKPFMPKGVWRFKSFEEADEWKMRMLTRKVDRELLIVEPSGCHGWRSHHKH
jgi:hypothetical protein